MTTLSEHYGQLLGLDGHWRVVDVDLSLGEQRVTIRLEPTGQPWACGGSARRGR
ncbi:MAG TPA: hypothetical protein GX399_03500 [Xanthomonadaceae bacterium]|nr:hypothetical protein [Xanthomonadaceae bacterium]